MDFKTTKAEVTLQNINYHLGLDSGIDVFTKINSLNVTWKVDISEKAWGICDMDVTIKDIDLVIEWEIYKEDINDYDKTSLMCKSDMFHTISETNKFFLGTIKIDASQFAIIENLEVVGGILEIEEIFIDFMDNEIHIL